MPKITDLSRLSPEARFLFEDLSEEDRCIIDIDCPYRRDRTRLIQSLLDRGVKYCVISEISGMTVDMVRHYKKIKKRSFAWPDDAKIFLIWLYLEEKKNKSFCIRETRREAEAKGWSLPSDSTLRRILIRLDRYKNKKRAWLPGIKNH